MIGQWDKQAKNDQGGGHPVRPSLSSSRKGEIMFRVYLTNFGWFANNGHGFDTLDQAVAYGKAKGFEFAIYQGADVIGSWSVFGGYRALR